MWRMTDRRPIEYDDLAIRIGPDGRGGFEAVVVHAPRGGAARVPFVPPYRAGELDAVLDGLVRAARSSAVPRHLGGAPVAPREPIEAREAGRALFEALFTGRLGIALALGLPDGTGNQARGLRLRLIVDPHQRDCAAVAALPWELLYDPARGFLALDGRTPVVRFLEVDAPHRVQPIRGALRVLVVLASPRGLPPLDLARERAAVESWRRTGGVEVEVLERATLDALGERLRRRRYHVLHFTGHGDYLAGEEGGVLCFERADGTAEPIDSEVLGALLGKCPSVRLVVLNACSSGRMPRREGRDPYAGVASALVRAGAPAVVAMQFPISDRAAVRFCTDFYRWLAEGDPIDAAVADGRLGIRREVGSGIEWAAPVLHLRVTGGRLFERAPVWPRRLAAVALTAAIAAAGLMGGWWLFDGADDAPPPYQRPDVATAEGCPPPPDLPDLAFVVIHGGSLELPPAKGREEEGPRVLTVDHDYCLSVFELTEEQRRRVMGIAGDRTDRPADPNLPAGRISWNEAIEIPRRLNGQVQGSPFRLPTGAEWEYAARAGTVTAYSFGDDPAELPRHGNCQSGRLREDDGFDHRAAPVGSFAPNQWGLYDVHGNVWEWVDEALAPREAAPAGAGSPADAETSRRVRRGGSYESNAENCTSEARSEPLGRYERGVNGLRLARDIEPGPAP